MIISKYCDTNLIKYTNKDKDLQTQQTFLLIRIEMIDLKIETVEFTFSEFQVSHSGSGADPGESQVNPFRRDGGTVLIPALPAPGASHHQASGGSAALQLNQGFMQMYGANPQVQAFYGGRMTEDRLLAVKNATCEAIDHLHKSLESCPDAETEAPDPKGIKVGDSFSHNFKFQCVILAWLGLVHQFHIGKR